MKTPSVTEIREFVRERYGAIATQDAADAAAGCGCQATECCTDAANLAPGSYTEALGYSPEEIAGAPAGADLGLGCGNPLAIASIRAGETVLDLGSGAGFDAFLAARQLQGTGRVIGVDMTPAMLARARRNAEKAGFANVEFRLGEIEALPVADASVDLVISNCVINLSPEKPRVLAEAFRVLRAGGRLAISDVVATRPLPEAIRAQLPQIGACVGGAILAGEMRQLLLTAGFRDIDVVPKTASRKYIEKWGSVPGIADCLVSAMITAWKP